MISEQALRKMPESAYMNDEQLAFFRSRLLEMRNEVLERQREARSSIASEQMADPADRATAEEERFLMLRLREREGMLLRRIDNALRMIADGEYGYCTDTGEPIGIARLIARPTATVCVDVKQASEQMRRGFRAAA